MRRNQSQFFKQQTFIRSLRNSVHFTKDNDADQLNHKQAEINKQMNRLKSCSKSKVCRLSTKQNTTCLKFKDRKNEKFYLSNNRLLINLNKKQGHQPILQKKTIIDSIIDSQELMTKNINILLTFKEQKYENAIENSVQNKFLQKNQLKILKMNISNFQLSIQDEFKIKRTFLFNLFQQLREKKALIINLNNSLKIQTVYINQKQLQLSLEQNKLLNQLSNNSYQFDPWKIINQNKILLQNKLSQRPKSKIKWAQASLESLNSTKLKQNNANKSDIQEDYGLNMSNLHFQIDSKQQKKGFSNIFNSKKYFEFNKDNNQNIYNTQINKNEVFSMTSTLQSQKNGSNKKSLFQQLSPDLKRKNKMISSLNFNQGRRIKDNENKSCHEGLSSTSRPKSSFKNLQQKNNYFQMKESERKKSLKKSIEQYSIRNTKCLNIPLIKSNEVKLQYGIK